jgi:hypothetical protein
MPIMYRRRLLRLDEQRITKLSMGELIEYETVLWQWMDKTGGAANIARQLNLIHREVEWRAMDKDWSHAAHS